MVNVNYSYDLKERREYEWKQEQLRQLPQCLRDKFARVDAIEIERKLSNFLDNLREFEEKSRISAKDIMVSYRAA